MQFLLAKLYLAVRHHVTKRRSARTCAMPYYRHLHCLLGCRLMVAAMLLLGRAAAAGIDIAEVPTMVVLVVGTVRDTPTVQRAGLWLSTEIAAGVGQGGGIKG